jgi:predicted nucleotidyltransferase
MSAPFDELVAIEAREFARTLAARWAGLLEAELIGVYLIGSLAHGGFSRRYSDIDVAVITERGLSPERLDRLRAEAPGVPEELASKLSIFWTDRGFSIGRFLPLDRIDYLDRAVPLREREHVVPARPALDEVRGYLAGAPFANWQVACAGFAASNTLDPKDRKSYLRAILYPARFAFSWSTGSMASNDEAVYCLAEHAPEGLDIALIREALACRQAAADPDPLFAARTALPQQVSACATLIGRPPPL